MEAEYGLSGLGLRVSYGLGERGMVCGGWGDMLWGFGGGLTTAGIQITTGCIVTPATDKSSKCRVLLSFYDNVVIMVFSFRLRSVTLCPSCFLT